MLLMPLSLLPGALALAGAQQPTPPDPLKTVRVLYPANRTVAQAGPVRLIVAAPKAMAKLAATLDGKPLALQRLPFADAWMTPGVLTATADAVADRAETVLWIATPKLAAGTHTAVVAGRKVQFRAVKGKAPSGWTDRYAHSTPAGAASDCAGCHDTKGKALGAATMPDTCSRCHDEATVQNKHSHTPTPLARCAMCHDPHGAPRPKLLLDEKKKLCSRCHEAGHSKS